MRLIPYPMARIWLKGLKGVPSDLYLLHGLACERYRSQTVCVIRIVVIGFALEPL